MDKWQAVHDFFASVGLNAYEENSVPTGELAPSFPYITYSMNTSYALDENNLLCSLWYYSTSLREIDQKTDEIASKIGLAKVIPCSEGAVIIRPGTPFSQGMSDNSDPMIKRKLIMLNAMFATTH